MRIALTSDTHYGLTNPDDIKKMLENLQAEKVDMVVHAGDWASCNSSQFLSCVRLFRKYFPDIPILGTLGNHDFWSKNPKVLIRNNEVFKKYNILNFWTNGTIKVVALQSWYNTCNPPSNDQDNMPPNMTHCDMIVRMHHNFDDVIDIIDENSVVVSHFTPYNYRYGYTSMCGPRAMFERITEVAKVLCLGHSHLHMDEMIGKCRVINCGSDYYKPKYLIFEV
jgi:predicted phosphodiesterase